MKDKTPHPDEGETLTMAEQYRKNHPNPQAEAAPEEGKTLAEIMLVKEDDGNFVVRRMAPEDEAEYLRKIPPPTMKQILLNEGWAPLEDYTPEEQEAITKGLEFTRKLSIYYFWATEYHAENTQKTQEAITLELTAAFPEFGKLWKEASTEKPEDVREAFAWWHSSHFPTLRASTKADVLFIKT